MKERPIIFNGEMVRAILEGRKTQTRRVIKPQPPLCKPPIYKIEPCGQHWHGFLDHQTEEAITTVSIGRCPYGVVGDRLWMREAIRRKGLGLYPLVRGDNVTYLADLTPVMGEGPAGSYMGRALVNWQWKHRVLPSIHMPRWASRLTLEITNVRVEQVQDINENDVDAEGIFNEGGLHLAHCLHRIFHPDHKCSCGDRTPEEEFAILWDSINAKRGFGWDTNPWVWVLEFRVLNNGN